MMKRTVSVWRFIVTIIGIVLFMIGSKQMTPSSIMVLSPDETSYKTTLWIKSFTDSIGREHPIGKRGSYIFLQGLEPGIGSCELIRYPVYYTWKNRDWGQIVKEPSPTEIITVKEGELIRVNGIAFLMRSPDSVYSSLNPFCTQTLWGLTYRSNLPEPYVPRYHPTEYYDNDVRNLY